MTEKELMQLKFLKLEIAIMREELEQLKSLRDYEALRIDGMPKSGTHSDRVANIAAAILDLEAKLYTHVEELLEKWDRCEQYIHSINDEDLRLMLRLRFIDGLVWEEVSEQMFLSETTLKRLMRHWRKTYSKAV